MLDRVNFALNNPLVTALGRGRERDTYVGFSNQTLGRYKRVLRASKDLGVDLTQFREVNYKDIDFLLQAKPAERTRMLQLAIQTKGQRIIHSKPEGGLGVKSGAGAGVEHTGDGEGDEHSGDESEGDDEDREASHLARVAGGGGAAAIAAGAAIAAPGLGQMPVDRVDVLQFPSPSDSEQNDPASVYARRTALLSYSGPSERKRLLEFVKQHSLFSEKGLLSVALLRSVALARSNKANCQQCFTFV